MRGSPTSGCAAAMPDDAEHQAIVREIAQLSVYAGAKLWIASPGLKAGA